MSAAASLAGAFADLEADFEVAYPGVDVVLNLGASSSMREQVLAGAPVDVFASADEADLEALVDAGLTASAPVVFATNRLSLAVPAGNPGEVRTLADLADPARFVGLCAESAPCGRLARDLLERASVEAAIDSAEPDVRALVTKLAEGELDAGIVYATDVVGSGGRIEAVEVPRDLDVAVPYPIAVMRTAADRSAAQAFVDHVLSEAGRAVLREHGFDVP